MAVRIRLSRHGSKKRPYYHIVAADGRMPRDGRFIEKLGTYNPMLPKDHADRLTFQEDRIKYWLGVGATPSERVQKFLATIKLAEKPVITVQTKKDKPRPKTLERIKEKEEKLKARAEAKKVEKETQATEAAAAEHSGESVEQVDAELAIEEKMAAAEGETLEEEKKEAAAEEAAAAPETEAPKEEPVAEEPKEEEKPAEEAPQEKEKKEEEPAPAEEAP